MVKNLAAPYDAGRRGSAWVKVKPVHTLDLVVLAVEWGSGRRAGLAVQHPPRRPRPATGGFVMLGKTFKGMTDEMLAWQTERFTELAIDPDGIRDDYVVHVRPEQVVEIAFDGLQRSTRYPGGMALRFARVVRYRDDKTRRRGRHRSRPVRRDLRPATVARRELASHLCNSGLHHAYDGPHDQLHAEGRPDGRRSAAAARRRAREQEILAATRALFDERGRPRRADRGHRPGGRDQPGDRLPALHRQGGALRAHPGRLPRRAARGAGRRGRRRGRRRRTGSRRSSARSSTTGSRTRRSSTAPRR